MSLRQAQRRLWELVPGLRQLHASSAAAALAGKPSDEWPPSFASTLKQQSRQFQPRLSTPLTQPLPGIQIIEHDAIPDTEPPTEITTLPNGVRLISEPSLGPTSAVGIYVNTGSVYETRESAGASTLLECLAYKSTKHRSTQQIDQELEKLGVFAPLVSSSREQMAYTTECLRTHVPAVLEVMADCVLNPLLEDQDVRTQKERLGMLLGRSDSLPVVLTELMLRGSYQGALGEPCIPDPGLLATLQPGPLRDFVASNYSPGRIVVAAAGMDHGQLVRLATPMFAQLPAAPLPREPASEYVGGFVHLPNTEPGPAGGSHLMLGFEFAGGWRNVQGSVVMTVLSFLLGGGSSFSSGGPGKGMASRLYQRVLHRHHWVSACNAFNNTFNDTGVVGITIACPQDSLRLALDVVCTEMEAVAQQPGRVELERAKALAKSMVCSALESKAQSAEDIGRQYLTYGRRISGREYMRMIGQVSPQDVSDFVRALLASPPALAVSSQRLEDVDYRAVAQRYGPGSTMAAAGQQRAARAPADGGDRQRRQWGAQPAAAYGTADG